MRDALRRWPAAARARLLRLNVISRLEQRDGLGRLADDPEWRRALEASRSGPRVLIATNTGGHFAIETIDRLLGAALTMRGAAVTHVLCDAALPACQMCEYSLTPDIDGFARKRPDPLLCGYCHGPAEARIQALGLDVRRLGASLTVADRSEAKALASDATLAAVNKLSWRGVPVGMHALAGALRFFARSDLEHEPHGQAVLRRYVEASALTIAAYLKLADELRPDVLIAHHGIYTPQGLAVAAARAKGVRVVTWNPAYRRHCFIFSHDDSYHYTLMDEAPQAWRDRPLSDAQRARIISYLDSREQGEGDWISFNRNADAALNLNELGLDPNKPLIAAYTNVFWDAQLHFPSNAFGSQKEWLERTIEWFARRPDLQLVIRVHPAEISGSPQSRQPAREMIAARFAQLPDNVKLVGPESGLSSYALAARADAALIFGTKLGVELSARGIPVVVAGEAWVRGKGFTHDVSSTEAYEAALAQLPFRKRLEPALQELALRYANHFFFGRMLELPFVRPVEGPRRFSVDIDGAADLTAGRWGGLDAICAGILENAPFVWDTARES